MIEWEDKVSRAQPVCSVSGVAIAPGARFYSLLRWHDQRFLRLDVAEESWDPKLTEGAVSWWNQRRPQAHEPQGPRLLSPDILFAIFTDLRDASERPKQCIAWLLALLLVRLKRLRYLDLLHENGDDILVVQERGGGQRPLLRIRDPRMNPTEEGLLQDQLDHLFTANTAADEGASGIESTATDETAAADAPPDP